MLSVLAQELLEETGETSVIRDLVHTWTHNISGMHCEINVYTSKSHGLYTIKSHGSNNMSL